MSFTPIDVDPDNPKTWEQLLAELRELKAQNARLSESAAKNKDQGLARVNEELRRANRALKALSRCKEAMIRAGDEAVLLNDVCRIIVDVGGYRLAWIGYIENDGAKTVRPAARSGYDEGYVDNLKIALEDPVRGNGPTGICLKTGKPYGSRDVRSDKEMRPWRKEALKRGYLSTLNLPIVYERQVIGALVIYSGSADAFDEEERGLLSELAQTLAYGITAIRDRAGRIQAEDELKRANEELEMRIDERTKKLRESEANLARAQRITHMGNWSWDTISDRVEGSVEFYRMFGFESREHITYDDFTAALHPDDRGPVNRAVRAALSGVASYNIDYRVVKPDGSERAIHAEGEVVRDSSGRPVQMFGTTQDITERKQAEAELAKAKMLVELYLDLMGHDINNYNQVAMGYLELLNGMLHDQELKVLAAKPMEAIASSTRLIENVRKLQKASTCEFKAHAVDLNEVLSELQAQYSEVPGKVIRVKYSRGRDCFVMANVLVKDVFSNLISNAIKHSGGKEPIEVAIRLTRMDENGKNYCRVNVEDNGPGIPDMVKNKLFHRFQRGDTKAHGKGLGLYLVRTLVEDYHGKVWVEDRVKGDHTKGARFVVMLPAVEK